MIYTNPDNVPGQPQSNYWTDIMRWLVSVMDDDDASLPFVASVLSYAFKNEGITEKQEEVIRRILKGTLEQFDQGTLQCQAKELITKASINKTSDRSKLN